MSPRCKRSAVAHADMVVVISRGCEARIWLTLNRFGDRPAIGDHLPGSRNLRGRVRGESLMAVATGSPQLRYFPGFSSADDLGQGRRFEMTVT